MRWRKLLTSNPGNEHRTVLILFQAHLAKIQALTNSALKEPEGLEIAWNEIVEETAHLQSYLKTREIREKEAQAQVERVRQRMQAHAAEKAARASKN